MRFEGMGTEVGFKSCFSGYYSMRNANDGSSRSVGPLLHGDEASITSHFYHGFIPRTVTDAYDKHGLKQKMLEHEAVFKNQVYELHRLYRRQRDMMELHKPKVRIFQLPLDQCDDPEEGEQTCSYKDGQSGRHFVGSNGLADLNEPVREDVGHQYADFLGSLAKPAASWFLDQPRQVLRRSCNGRGFPSCMHEAGNFSSCFKCNKFLVRSCPIQHENGEENQHSGIHSEILTRSRNLCHFNETPLCFVSSRPSLNSSDTANSWSPSCGKLNGSLTSKLTSFQTHSLPRNGFCHEASVSKELSSCLPVLGFDHQNRKTLEGSWMLFKSLDFVDVTDSTGVMDLNKVQALSSEDDNTSEQLQAKPVIGKNNTSCNPLLKNGDLDESLANNIKLLGHPVFSNSCKSRNDSSFLVSASVSVHCAPKNGKRDRGIDINVAWDPTSERIETGTCEVGKFKNSFDLNSCVTDDEDLLLQESVKSSGEKAKKTAMEIDLEAPAVPETEEDAPEKNLDCLEDKERARLAAGAIVAISGQQDHGGSMAEVVVVSSGDDPLRWFVDVVTELDEYEVLTLQLEETKEDDYMWELLGPGSCEPDEPSPGSVPSRPRRGQARRGRPRRDFRRDILPGLVSLSRHEVTEDLQIFEGLMKAMGHSLSSRITRRLEKQSGIRRRRKAATVEVESIPAATNPPQPLPALPILEQTNNIKLVGLEEQRLMGWGKTTRRPRSHRCAVLSVNV